MLSWSSDEEIYGGTVSMWVEKTSSGVCPSMVATTLKRSCATGILCVVYPMLSSTSYSSAPTAPSLPEMDSMSISLRVRAMGSIFFSGQDNKLYHRGHRGAQRRNKNLTTD